MPARREGCRGRQEGGGDPGTASRDRQGSPCNRRRGRNSARKERGRLAKEEAEKAKRLVALDLDQKSKQLSELTEVLKQRDAKLAEAQRAQADLLKKERELADAKREMDLTIQKQVQTELSGVREKAKKEAEEALSLKMRERDEQIASMQRQIEELKRKAEQGSQQLQGEAQELELESTLRQKFPLDLIERVAKGEFGGDLIHRVVSVSGQCCGTILWEAKRTKNWSDGWLGKLREDKRNAKADLALIVSHALPKGLEHFDHIEGVWVTNPRCAVPVAIALRQTLIELSAARIMSEGQQTKMEIVYQYLTGPRFRHRVEAIVERFSAMQEDLDRSGKRRSDFGPSAKSRSEASLRPLPACMAICRVSRAGASKRSKVWRCRCSKLRSQREGAPMSATANLPVGNDNLFLGLNAEALASQASLNFGMSALELDGYLTGVVVAPNPIMPNRWMAGLWSEEQSVFDDPNQAQYALSAIRPVQQHRQSDRTKSAPFGIRAGVRLPPHLSPTRRRAKPRRHPDLGSRVLESDGTRSLGLERARRGRADAAHHSAVRRLHRPRR